LELNTPGLLITDTVILIDIKAADYRYSEIEDHWRSFLGETNCPCCGMVGQYGRHGLYYKYHYRERIVILRVRCRGCRTTHALIPSFSLPGTSIGTEEAEQYLMARHRGISRGKASKGLLSRGLSEEYPKGLERRLEVVVDRGKALFAGDGNPELSGLSWIWGLCGPTDRPLYAVNRYALSRRVNGLCFCRSSILFFRRDPRSGQFPHKGDSAAEGGEPVDSW
jgi:hypothetical protein